MTVPETERDSETVKASDTALHSELTRAVCWQPMSEQTASVTQPISWEAVKALAMVVGVREAARRMELSEEQVKKRCTREGWLSDPRARQAAANGVALRSGISPSVPMSPMSPAALIAQELCQLSSETKMGFARAMKGVAKHVETRDPEENLADAGNVKAAAQTAELIHGWRDQPKPSAMRLEVLLTKPEVHVDAIEIQSEVVQDQWDDARDTQSI